jgi:hypothetical protein
MSYFITSIPKSGTHLLATVIQDLTGAYPRSVKKIDGRDTVYGGYEPSESLVGHFRARAIRNNESLAKLFSERQVLVLVRDPRAICNSMLHHLMTSRHRRHQEGRDQVQALPFNEQIIRVSKGLFAADGRNIVAELAKMCTGFAEIKKLYPDAVFLRYEDFFDPAFTAEKMPGIFGIDAQRAREVVDRALTGGSRTKREGNPNGWRAVFDADLVNYFDINYGGLINQLGYPD